MIIMVETIDISKSYEEIFNGKSDVPLHPSIKKQIQGFIDMLQEFYDKKIDNPEATELDALEYIPLFNINGLLIASMLGVTMEEYYLVTDYMIRLLGIEAEYDEK